MYYWPYNRLMKIYVYMVTRLWTSASDNVLLFNKINRDLYYHRRLPHIRTRTLDRREGRASWRIPLPMTTKVIGSRLTAMVSDVVQDRRILVLGKQFVSESFVIN